MSTPMPTLSPRGGRSTSSAPRRGRGRPPIRSLPLGLGGLPARQPAVRPDRPGVPVGELHFNYTQCVFIADVLPATFSLATTPRLGAWLDRTNPLIAWSRIRLGWGIDPLLLALSPIWPAGSMAIAATARLIRGGVMNGSYILWWGSAGTALRRRGVDLGVRRRTCSASTACSAWSGRRWGPTSARSSRDARCSSSAA